MKLTPLDIKKQEFKKSIRGYDAVEVEAFLEVVADEFESVVREKTQLADEVLKLRTQLKDYRRVEDSLKDTLVSAQENLNSSRENSKREADLIIRDAELKAEKILAESRRNLEKIKNDIIIVRAQKESFARRLRHLLESQMELIGVLELDDKGFVDEVEKPKQAKQGNEQENSSLRSADKLKNQKDSIIINDNSEDDKSNDGDDDKLDGKKTAKLPRIKNQYLT
ncbi:MAG: DivIVA domain-containing protein [Deferribacteres bacterium]|nr:DivIVA domain-containing protein [candidate division KSB1 bacterium]MCB9504041.1 DivIVA domain-containing protein [Deferribacteres bacterium]